MSERLVGHGTAAEYVGAHGNTLHGEGAHADGSGRDYPGRNPARKMPSAALVLESVVFHLCGEVGMRRSGYVRCSGIVGAARVRVRYHDGERTARGEASADPAQYAERILFDTGGVGRAGRSSARKPGGDGGLVHGNAGCQAVKHGSHRRAVAFTEDGELYACAYGVLHLIRRTRRA